MTIITKAGMAPSMPPMLVQIACARVIGTCAAIAFSRREAFRER
jgi:hypothetical protein